MSKPNSSLVRKSLSGILAVLLLVFVMLQFPIPAASPTNPSNNPNATEASISFYPSSTVTEGTIVTITGTVVFKQSGQPVTGYGETIEIQQFQSGGEGVPCDYPGGNWETIASGSPNTNGEYSYLFDTTGLGGKTIGFRVFHPANPGKSSASNSPCVNLVIDSASTCSEVGVLLGTRIASGEGEPQPGSTNIWVIRVELTNCLGSTTTFKVQGGTNGWTTFVGYSASVGDVSVRRNNRNQVLTWIVELDDQESATLDIELQGTIPSSAPCGEVRGLLGPWSAAYVYNGIKKKSDYTGKITIEVTCPSS